MPEVLSVETSTHGRVLVERRSDPASGWLVAFHGYGESADDIHAEVTRIPGVDRWHVVAVQALNRFYTRNDQKVIASWMTRQDRDVAIADNIAYVDRVVDPLVPNPGTRSRLVFAGFSQGVAMAYRAALLGARSAAGVIALAGDIPPELKTNTARDWPRVLIGVGDTETWYSEEKQRADVAFLESRRVQHEFMRFRGGHEWTDEFREAAGRWLGTLEDSSNS